MMKLSNLVAGLVLSAGLCVASDSIAADDVATVASVADPGDTAGEGLYEVAYALSPLPAQTQTGVNGTYSTDGSGTRTNWLLGAYQLVSAGALNQEQTGGTVTLGVSGGKYTVSIGSNPQNVSALSNGGPGTPWASGLLAASKGSDGQYWGSEGSGYDRNGGYGGAVNLTVKPANSLQPVEVLLDTSTLPAVTGSLTLTGVLALSQGGHNSSRWEYGIKTGFKHNDYYSTPGNAGAVSVDFTGNIRAQGGYASSAGQLVIAEVGIAAISRGAALVCDSYNCKDHYEAGFNYEKPGTGSSVNVILRRGSQILLQQGSTVGIYALSANGGMPSVKPSLGYNVNTSGLVAGPVKVVVEQGATIRVGKADAVASAGILAISAGSELDTTLSDASYPYENAGGEGVGSTVTVDNAGEIKSEGILALGIGALSLGGSAAVGLLGVTPGEYLANKKSPSNPGTLGDVTVTNTGSISTSGDSAHGIVAGSLGSGGVVYAALSGDEAARKAIAESCTQKVATTADGVRSNAALGAAPLCEGVTTGLTLGNKEGTSAVNGGAVLVTNRGTITTGVQGVQAGSAHAMGVFAQSIGGGGGNGSGGFLFWPGDAGGSGGNGGNVTVTNSGDVSTYGGFSTGVLAQSIGGGGGVGGSTNFLPWIAVGARGGSGGSAGTTTLNLDSAGTITTKGEFAQGVLAQSVGGGGGKGGAANGYGAVYTISVGGAGGSGGNGGSVAVNAANNGDRAWNAATRTVNNSAFDILTYGEHGTGIVAQSIGGGGGVGGHARSISGSVLINLNLSFGGPGGVGGKGGAVNVYSDLDIYSEGNDSIGILAQSIGGGGGAGGSAYSNAATLEIPSEGDIPVPNFTYVAAFGGKGGSGNTASATHVYNGGLVATSGDGAIGILAQSVGGGGGAGGAATAISRAIPIQTKGTSAGETIAVNVVSAVGGNGGSGGNGGEVIVHNASHASSSTGGAVLTQGDHGAGIVAQSIGGGGGKGGDADAVLYTMALSEFVQDLIKLTPPEKQARSIFAIDVAVAVGGTGGAGGDAGYVQVYNGEQVQTATGYAITPALIQTSGGASPGIVAQSIGGGGGNGGEGAVSGMGATVTINVGVGGSGGSGGAGGAVYVLNPAGASIRTGSVLRGEASQADISSGSDPFALVTTGGGAVGILAQSIGGGGGTGGSADAASALDNSWQSDVALGVTVLSFAQKIDQYAKEGKADFLEPGVNANISVGGSGGASGSGKTVLVDNGGAIETFGEQAHGIQAQSIGAGGGNGGAVEATSAFWQSKVASALGGEAEVTIGMSVGGRGGSAGNGDSVTVNQYAGSSIVTHGYGANGIFAQSIGGGGGYGGHATANAEGFLYIGGSVQGNAGATGTGGKVTVSSAGSIETWGDDANAILAQSIGGGGGSGVVGCTNSNNGFPIGIGPLGGASPCWGNHESTDGDKPKNKEWGSFISISGNLGGGKSYKTDTGDDGGTVTANISKAIVTHGNRSMGVVAQSIGGGGGFLSGDATGFKETIVAPDAGHSHSHGRAVTVNVNAGGSISTYGDGAWGVLAQSIGGSGGFVGDPSLNLGLLVSNTIQTVCCNYKSNETYVVSVRPYIEDFVTYSYTTGADGGDVTVSLAANTSITTRGRNAHGIVAQSAGGGGGIAAGGGNSASSLVYMGNPLASAWNGVKSDDPIWWTGKGGNINITVASGATVDVQGAGSIGILAQSTGDKNYQSPINITVAGTVIGGSGYNNAGNLNMLNKTGTLGNLDAAAILVSGGADLMNRATPTPNQITITSTGKVQGRDQYQNAIVSIDGRTNVTSDGYIVGSIKLGSSSSDPNRGVFINRGTWVAGVNNVFSNNSVQNYGVIRIVQPTEIIGSLKHYAGGEIRFNLDPAVHFNKAALTVSGLARLEGKITPVLDSLRPGEFRLVKAGSIESSASIDNPLLFDWRQRVTTDGELRLSALADFRPAGLLLSANQQAAAQYLERAWDKADPYFAGHSAYMLRMESADQYRAMLDAIGGAELLHPHSATLQAIPTLLGDAIDCPTMGVADVIVGEDSCAWMGVGQSRGRYAGDDTRRARTDADLFSFGLQKEFSPGWYLSGVIGRVSSGANAGSVSGSGQTTVGSVGVKRQSGNWILGASLAWGSGSHDSVRRFALPLVGGSASAPDALLRSDSDLDILALRARASYEFDRGGWYLRPTLDVDALQTKTSGFDEQGAQHLFRLSGDGETRRELVATPHVELGSLFNLGGETRLRAYVDAGARLAPDGDRETDVRILGADSSVGFLRNRVGVPFATWLIKAGAQVYSDGALNLRVEYALEDNEDFRNETAMARLEWHF